MTRKIIIIIFSLILTFIINNSYGQINQRIYGVTIDAVNNLNNITMTLAHHSHRMTTRIVFDEWQPATAYQTAVNRIDSVSDIMGEILDSYYMNQYSVQQYKDRVAEYCILLHNRVDIWEIGNEVNGEWLGNTDSVIEKISYAFIYTNKRGYKNALTLYYNHNCWERPENEMFRWVNEKLPNKIKYGIDYLLVSYYEDDCNNFQPNWQQVFDSLHVLFPNSKLGIGECGTIVKAWKEPYITRYYTMNITTPGYIGGYFWWYYRQDCIPYTTKPLWLVLENAINGSNTNFDGTPPGDYKR